MKLPKTSILEHGDHVYITSPVQLYEPDAAAIEQFAFATDLRSAAPNPKLLWLRGQYVEADNANSNGDQWTAGDLGIKALTPVLMPITVMHDLRSAVGTIADAKLLTPEKDNVPRARIDTVLALWEHRFPEVAAEARINASQGTLMQSMECISSAYACSECGATFHRLPAGAEKRDWCAHLRGETLVAGGTKASRILGNVTFTGVGLIFGTRGARGAYKDAHLDVEELAAFHNEVHAGTVKRTRRKNTMEIDDAKYEALVAARTAADAKVAELTAAVATKDKDIEKLEADKLAAEEKATKADTAKLAAEEAVRVAAMRDERLAALGAGFKAKLDKLATTSALVKKQAGEMSDADWTARLTELSETLAIKHDAAAETITPDPADPAAVAAAAAAAAADPLAGMVFTREQVATSVTGAVQEVTAGDNTPTAPSSASRQSVVGGLIKRPARRPAKA